MLDRGYPDDISGLLPPNAPPMYQFQNHYGSGGQFGQNLMYAQNQRPSFAIQEILGLSNPSCRQNTSPELLDTSGGMSSANLMYVSRDYSGINSGNYNGALSPESLTQNYLSAREQTQQTQNQAFCPWRFDALSQTTVNNQQIVQTVTSVVPRQLDNGNYCYKTGSLGENEGKFFSHYINTPGRRQSKTPILSMNENQKSIETVFSIAICRPTGDKWQSKTLFLSIFDPRSSIVDNVFDYRLPSVVDQHQLINQ